MSELKLDGVGLDGAGAGIGGETVAVPAAESLSPESLSETRGADLAALDSTAEAPTAEVPTVEPVVSILVVSYNTKAMTIACLDSVIAETTVPYELIVLDNLSPDGSAAAIAEAFPDIRLIASQTNYGFARGNNVAAIGARGKYLLLLNPDTVVLDGAIDKLLAFAEANPAAGIWGGRTVKGDGITLDPMCCFGDQTLWSLFCRTTGLSLALRQSPRFNPEEYGGWARDSARDVDVVQGSFFLIRRDLWESLGGFDLTFVMYGEEADLCRRARARGAQPRMTPAAQIIHYGGASSKRRADKDALILKARVTLVQRHLPAWQQPFALFLLRMWPLSRKLGGSLMAALTGGRKGRTAAEHWGAVWQARGTWQTGFPTQPHP